MILLFEIRKNEGNLFVVKTNHALNSVHFPEIYSKVRIPILIWSNEVWRFEGIFIAAKIKPMKSIHTSIKKKDIHLVEWLNEARQLEDEDKLEAVKEYKKIALSYPVSEKAYDRLMVLFRQLKSPKDEIYWIDKGIGQFEKRYKKPAIRSNSKIAILSKSLLTSTGLADKSGNALYRPEPLGRWQKRKDLLIKKMKKN